MTEETYGTVEATASTPTSPATNASPAADVIPAPDPVVALEMEIIRNKAAWDAEWAKPGATGPQMQAFAARDLQLKDALERHRGGAGADAEAPPRKLSADPVEAEMGLAEAEVPDVHAIERMLEHHPDVDLRRPGALRLAQALSAKVPRELVPEATNLLLTFKAMADDPARTQEWTAELAQKELERRHGAKKAEGLVTDAQKLWRELGAVRDLFEDDWIEDEPDAIEKLAEFSDLYFSSDAGMRVTLKRNAAAAAAQDRDRAERAAAERALDERFRYGR